MIDGLDLITFKSGHLLLSESIFKRWSVKVEIAESNKEFEVNWSSVCWSKYPLAPSQKETLLQQNTKYYWKKGVLSNVCKKIKETEIAHIQKEHLGICCALGILKAITRKITFVNLFSNGNTNKLLIVIWDLWFPLLFWKRAERETY